MLNTMFRNLADIIFPPHCLSCNKPGNWICKRCENLLLINNIPECAVCRKISTGFTTHIHCRQNLPIDKVIICWQYNSLARSIMNSFKRNLRYAIVEQLIELCIPRVSPYLTENAILVPVPSTQYRIRNRGFNQSKVIADCIAVKTKAEVREVLCRTNDSHHQTGQTLEQRVKQDLTTFRINTKTSDSIRGRNIVLVDDVCTTGTTLKNCALTLQNFTPKSISAFTLFRGKRLSTKRLSTKRLSTKRTSTTRPCRTRRRQR